MSLRGVALGALLGILWAGPVPGQQRPVRQPPLADLPGELQAYIAQAVRDWDVPGLAVAVVHHDTVFAKGFGVRELGRPEPVSAHTVFNIASLSKSFTAAAAAILVDEGRLHWDDPVRRHLPGIELPDPYVTREVTLRDLLSHRTGYFAANMMWLVTDVDRAEVLRRMRFLPAERPFRTGMVYSNVGYTLAGEVAAAVAGTTWEELVETRLLEPLGMTETTVRFDGLVAKAGERREIAEPHAVIADTQRSIPFRDYTNTAPSASVNSTALDLARWLRFHLAGGVLEGKRVLSDSVMFEMHSPQTPIPVPLSFKRARLVEHYGAYGLGWQVMDFRGRRMKWHSGNAQGMPSYMAILPDQQVGVVVLLNTWKAPVLHGAIAARVFDTFLGIPRSEWRDESGQALAAHRRASAQREEGWKRRMASRISDAPPSRPLAEYAGQYADSLYGEITVRADGPALVIRFGRGQEADLAHWHYDTFDVRWRNVVWANTYPAFVSFDLGADGRVVGLRMQLNRDDIRAGRRPQ